MSDSLKLAAPAFLACLVVWVVVDVVLDAVVFDSPVEINWTLAIVIGAVVAASAAGVLRGTTKS